MPAAAAVVTAARVRLHRFITLVCGFDLPMAAPFTSRIPRRRAAAPPRPTRSWFRRALPWLPAAAFALGSLGTLPTAAVGQVVNPFDQTTEQAGPPQDVLIDFNFYTVTGTGWLKAQDFVADTLSLVNVEAGGLITTQPGAAPPADPRFQGDGRYSVLGLSEVRVEGSVFVGAVPGFVGTIANGGPETRPAFPPAPADTPTGPLIIDGFGSRLQATGGAGRVAAGSLSVTDDAELIAGGLAGAGRVDVVGASVADSFLSRIAAEEGGLINLNTLALTNEANLEAIGAGARVTLAGAATADSLGSDVAAINGGTISGASLLVTGGARAFADGPGSVLTFAGPVTARGVAAGVGAGEPSAVTAVNGGAFNAAALGVENGARAEVAGADSTATVGGLTAVTGLDAASGQRSELSVNTGGAFVGGGLNVSGGAAATVNGAASSLGLTGGAAVDGAGSQLLSQDGGAFAGTTLAVTGGGDARVIGAGSTFALSGGATVDGTGSALVAQDGGAFAGTTLAVTNRGVATVGDAGSTFALSGGATVDGTGSVLNATPGGAFTGTTLAVTGGGDAGVTGPDATFALSGGATVDGAGSELLSQGGGALTGTTLAVANGGDATVAGAGSTFALSGGATVDGAGSRLTAEAGGDFDGTTLALTDGGSALVTGAGSTFTLTGAAVADGPATAGAAGSQLVASNGGAFRGTRLALSNRADALALGPDATITLTDAATVDGAGSAFAAVGGGAVTGTTLGVTGGGTAGADGPGSTLALAGGATVDGAGSRLIAQNGGAVNGGGLAVTGGGNATADGPGSTLALAGGATVDGAGSAFLAVGGGGVRGATLGVTGGGTAGADGVGSTFALAGGATVDGAGSRLIAQNGGAVNGSGLAVTGGGNATADGPGSTLALTGGAAVDGAGSTLTASGGVINGTTLAVTGGGRSRTLSGGRTTLTGGATVAGAGSQLNVLDGGTFNAASATLASGLIDVRTGGALTLRNGATVNGGEARVNGTLTAADLLLNRGGLLTGAGTIVGDLRAAGRISPGSGGPGVLNVDGNFTGTPTAIYDVEVRAAAAPVAGVDFDQVAVTGAATVNGGTVNVLPFGNQDFAVGTRYDFLTAGGGLTVANRVAVNDAPAGARFAQLIGPNSYALVVARNDARALARTFNQRAVAGGLAAAAGNPALRPLRDALDTLPNEQAARDALDGLSGEIYATQLTALNRGNLQFLDVVGRGGAFPLVCGACGVTGPGQRALRGWIEGYGAGGRVEGDGNAERADLGATGAAVGLSQIFGGSNGCLEVSGFYGYETNTTRVPGVNSTLTDDLHRFGGSLRASVGRGYASLTGFGGVTEGESRAVAGDGQPAVPLRRRLPRRLRRHGRRRGRGGRHAVRLPGGIPLAGVGAAVRGDRPRRLHGARRDRGAVGRGFDPQRTPRPGRRAGRPPLGAGDEPAGDRHLRGVLQPRRDRRHAGRHAGGVRRGAGLRLRGPRHGLHRRPRDPRPRPDLRRRPGAAGHAVPRRPE